MRARVRMRRLRMRPLLVRARVRQLYKGKKIALVLRRNAPALHCVSASAKPGAAMDGDISRTGMHE